MLIKVLHNAETCLEFPLQELLWRIYTEVANGGFGYSHGLLCLLGGMRNEDGNDAITQYFAYGEPDPDDPYWHWPHALLPFGHLGCAIYRCAQWDKMDTPIIWFNPNPHENGQTWDSSFISFCSSLVEYFST